MAVFLAYALFEAVWLLWVLCEAVWLLRGGLGHRGDRRNGDQGAEAHRDILLDHHSSSSIESFELLFARTFALCASHAELEMNVDLPGSVHLSDANIVVATASMQRAHAHYPLG